MAIWNIFRVGIVGVVLCAALPAWADTEFHARRATRDDAPLGTGRCEIRLQVDGEVEVKARGDVISIRTISGQGARDDGSECNMPLPGRRVAKFRFEAKEKGAEIRLVDEPSQRNGWAAVVHIRGGASGYRPYQFRLSWKSGADSSGESPRDYQPDERGNLSWNNTQHFSGAGQGESQTGDAAQQRLGAVAVDIDRGGRIQVSFHTSGHRPLLFTGTLMSSEGDSMKADVTSEDQRLHGPLFLSFDSRHKVVRIALEATDGRDRLRLNWERR